MQITILPLNGGFEVSVSNYPHFKKYMRSEQYQVRELIDSLLSELEAA